MTLSAIELTSEEAMHPNLATVGEAIVPAFRMVPETLPATTEGLVEQKVVRRTTVSRPHCNSTFILYVQLILSSTLHNTLLFVNVKLLERVEDVEMQLREMRDQLNKFIANQEQENVYVREQIANIIAQLVSSVVPSPVT